MSEIITKKIDPTSSEFKKGVEAGLNSKEDTKNWKAGNKLGQELKNESETQESASGASSEEPSTPLFVSSNEAADQQNVSTETDKL